MNRIASYHEIRRLRRSGMVTLTLTDLLLVVLFVLLLFTFRATEERRVEISATEAHLLELEVERNRLRQELADALAENARHKAQVKDLNELVARLLRKPQSATLPADPATVIADMQSEIASLRATIDRLNERLRDVPAIEALEEELDRAKKELDSRERLIAALQSDVAEKEAALRQRGRGTGYPRCLVTSGFLFRIILRESGNLLFTPSWEEGAERLARGVPGVSELANAGEVSLAIVRQQAGRILAWSNKQEVPCRFRVDTERETRDLDMYLRQMQLIERYFYAKRY
jgi:hypothetical protein